MIQYADDVVRAAYQQSQGQNNVGSAAGLIGSMVGNIVLWSAMENAVKVNAVGLGQSPLTEKFLSWMTQGKFSISPLESVTSRMDGWIYAKNPGMGFLLPNAGMREVGKATYSALGDLASEGIEKLATKEGLRLLVGSAASVISTGFGIGVMVDIGSFGLTLAKSVTDNYAHLGRKFMFAPWNMTMSDNKVPMSKQFQAMNQQAVSQLMQSRQMIAQHTSINSARSLYNNPYDFYNFI